MAEPPAWRKDVEGLLSKTDTWDWNSVYVEVGQTYSSRVLSHAWETFKRHRKGEAIGGAIVPPVAALVTGTLTGSLSTGLWAGLITLIGVLLVIFLAYLIAAPKEIDEALRGDLSAAHNQIAEEKRKLRQVALLVAENRVPVVDGEIVAQVQQPIGRVYCHLRDDVNQQIEGATVTLENEATGRRYSGITNYIGELELTVPEGLYTARMGAPGHSDLIEAINVEDLAYIHAQLQTQPETRRKREIKNAENAIEQITKCSEQGNDLLMRARLNPGAGKYLVDEIDAWEAESTECVARWMGHARKTIFMSESPIEIYHIDAATSAHRNLLNRINTKVVRLNKMLQELSDHMRLWSE